ncbi:MAG TPA: serine hydrolase domain-containing protein [Euzebyales bacterium]|nr:serine hydrolase domain-containing protein [Euzebyales bacterium]
MTDVRQQVQATIDELVGSGAERGIAVAAYHDGEQVVDAVAGVADPATGRPVTSGTPFHNFSIGKGATATVAHILAERGCYTYDTPVVELWPEFGAHGKQGVTVRHVLTHSAGVPGIPLDTTPEQLCDWDHMCAVIADSEPWWAPGSQSGYHAYTFGHLVGEIARRATGAPIGEVLRDEVTAPLGVADELYFGMPVAEHGRLARLEDAPGADGGPFDDLPRDLPMFKTGPMALSPTAALGNRTDILAADIPACGKTSARAMARMYAALLGDVDGVRLIPEARLRAATSLAASGVDAIMGNPCSWALGYALGLPDSAPGADRTVFAMGGAGGSFAFGDTATRVSCAVTKNTMTMDLAAATRISRMVVSAFGQ